MKTQRHIDATREGGHVTAGAEVEVITTVSQRTPRIATSRQKLGRSKEGLYLSEKAWAC